ncbi:hypothetical protein J437_LFUL010978 [Ladona fulva]|uniref:Uncharacterized protein n=1 Tax=Ladona fulva TaxID=123851 RepID=A0A8K0K5W0_LADFU|nr:hypothetical protein J437_LFUL010978 [Ladona fulva]
MMCCMFTTWGRRVGLKLEQLRRGDSKESLNGKSFGSSLRKRSWRLGRSASDSRPDSTPPPEASSRGKVDRAESIKSFFFRMGSTGALHTYSSSSNNNESSSRRQQFSEATGKLLSGSKAIPPSANNSVLLRSCSTSQLSTYVRGEDPTEGLDLSSLKCGPDSAQRNGDPGHQSGDEVECLGTGESDTASVAGSDVSSTYVPTKTMSCDNISTLGTGGSGRRGHFPYAFLRSKLSVLPEENGGSVINRRRAKSQITPAAGSLYSAAEEDGVFSDGPETRGSLLGTSTSSPPTLRASRLRATSEELFHRLSGPPSESPYRIAPGTRTLGRKGDFFETRSLRLHYPMSQSYAAIPYRNDDVFLPLSTTKLSVAPPPPPLYISSNESGYDSDGPRAGDDSADGRVLSAARSAGDSICPTTPHVATTIPGADAEDGDSGIANESSDSGSLHDSELGASASAGVESLKELAGCKSSDSASNGSSFQADEFLRHGTWSSSRQRRASMLCSSGGSVTPTPTIPRSSSDTPVGLQRGETIGGGWERRGVSGRLLPSMSLQCHVETEASPRRQQHLSSSFDRPMSETIHESPAESEGITDVKPSSSSSLRSEFLTSPYRHSLREGMRSKESSLTEPGSRVLFRRFFSQEKEGQELGAPAAVTLPPPVGRKVSETTSSLSSISESGRSGKTSCRKFKLVRLTRTTSSDLGIYISPRQLHGPLGMVTANGYVVVKLEEGGIAQRLAWFY